MPRTVRVAVNAYGVVADIDIRIQGPEEMTRVDAVFDAVALTRACLSWSTAVEPAAHDTYRAREATLRCGAAGRSLPRFGA
jgi:hypothetical protein